MTYDTVVDHGNPRPGVVGAAHLSADGVYRYLLTRRWDSDRHALQIVMLNPSTASGLVDDPTIRRCEGYARRERFGGVDVVNLYALRSTDPAALRTHDDPVGPLNDDFLVDLLARARWRGDPVLCAWGTKAEKSRVSQFLALANGVRARGLLHALSTTKAGHPGHPLYLPLDAPLEPWRG